MINHIPEPPDDPAPEPVPPPDDAREIERLLAMSDEEILAEARNDGIDVEAVAQELATQFRVIAQLVKQRDRARELLGQSWLRNARMSREMARAVALLRACERLDAVVQRWDGEIAGSILLDDWFIEDELCLGEVQYGPLAAAIIALAARLEARERRSGAE